MIPVELTAFDAVVNESGVQLTWKTVCETNNAGFEVQHRKEETFEKVGFVREAGTTSQPQRYRFQVGDLAPGQYAFRLKQVDVDGSSKFGPAVEVGVRARLLFRPPSEPDCQHRSLHSRGPQERNRQCLRGAWPVRADGL